jgi:nucleoside 2-deoxyribosyltransferase
MLKVYLASPLGFSPEWKSYRDKIKRRLTELGCTVLDPWDPKFHKVIAEATAIQDWSARIAAFKEIARQIGKANEEMIRSCDIVLGVLDGPELDSGTASEIGFAVGLGKKCYGLRTDFGLRGPRTGRSPGGSARLLKRAGQMCMLPLSGLPRLCNRLSFPSPRKYGTKTDSYQLPSHSVKILAVNYA